MANPDSVKDGVAGQKAGNYQFRTFFSRASLYF